MQEEIRRYAEQLRSEKGLNLAIRIGVNTGDVVARSICKDEHHSDYLPIGHPTSLASRMQSLAMPGSIVVSEQHTERLAEGYFRFNDLGPARIKGLTEPIRVFEVEGAGPLRSRFQVSLRRGLSRFVGRERELEALRGAPRGDPSWPRPGRGRRRRGGRRKVSALSRIQAGPPDRVPGPRDVLTPPR
jgi:hypothetical protein